LAVLWQANTSISWRLCDNKATDSWENEVMAREIAASVLHHSAQSLIFALQQAIAASPLLGVSSLDSGRSRSGLFLPDPLRFGKPVQRR
jgi:hypothetical protein